MTDPAVLALISDPALREDLDRVAAAAGLRVVHQAAGATPDRRAWKAAAAIVLDPAAAADCPGPRRPAIYVVTAFEAGAETLRAALAVGAGDALRLPDDEQALLRALAEAGGGVRDDRVAAGALLAVLPGHGGAGASVLAAALAQRAGDALLVDLDEFGGGVDLLFARENDPGLRWPDLTVCDGGLDWAALRRALPGDGHPSLLSAGPGAEISPTTLLAVCDAARRAGVTVVCDLPGRPGEAAETALRAADLVVLVCQATVRGCASARARSHGLAAFPNSGVVVRGPAPGGLRAADIAAATGLPLLAAMRPEPMLAERLERSRLRLRSRGPLAQAAGAVLGLVEQQHLSARSA